MNGNANTKRNSKTYSKRKINKAQEISGFGTTLMDEVILLIIIVISFIVTISLFISKMGFLGGFINSFFKGALGIGGYMLPIGTIIYCFWLLLSETKEQKGFKLIMFTIFTILISSFLGVFNSPIMSAGISFFERCSELYKNGGAFNGGLIGGFFSWIFVSALGKIGSAILILAFIIATIILFTQKSLLVYIMEFIESFKEDEEDYEIEYIQPRREEKVQPKYEEKIQQKIIKKEKKKGNFNIKISKDEGLKKEKKAVPVVEAMITKQNGKNKILKNPKSVYDFNKIVNIKDMNDKSNKNLKYADNENISSKNADNKNINLKSIKENNNTPRILQRDIPIKIGGNTIGNFIDYGEEIKSEPEIKKSDKQEKEYDGIIKIIDSSENKKIVPEIEIDIGFNEDIKIADNKDDDEINEKIENVTDKEIKEYEKEFFTDSIQNREEKQISNIENKQQITKKNNNSTIKKTKENKLINNAKNSNFIPKDKRNIEYIFPPIDLLSENKNIQNRNTRAEMIQNAEKLEETLKSFGVNAKVIQINKGPTITRYELSPSQGVKVSKIVNLADDIALNLAASGIRIEAPIPGKAAIGIEVPNKVVQSVYLRDVLESENFQNFPSKLAFALGEDIAGNAVIADIAKMPHLLIAGATGSGKSVCINTLITSIIYKAKPQEVKLLLIDPKVVELSVYNGIPHLLIPVVTDPKKASSALSWAVREMMQRYNDFAENNVRDIKGFNSMKAKKGETDFMPQIVIIIDELADLMIAAPGEVEDLICRLAQMARAAGIHLIIATQRPSVDVITGVIKANMPSRLAFAVSSGVDSKTILDSIGAEKLLGKGDMLFCPLGQNKPTRIQGAFISDKEVEDIVEFIKKSGSYSYDDNVMSEITQNVKNIQSADKSDEFFQQAVKLVIEKKKASVSMLQRQFRIGYNRAARIMEDLYSKGIVGAEEGSKPRKVLITEEEFEEMKNDL